MPTSTTKITRSLSVLMTDTNNDDVKMNLNYINQQSTDQELDIAVKAIAALTTNTYVDTTVTEKYSLNDATQ